MQSLVKEFTFDERIRSRVTFSDADKIRLNADTHRLELKSIGFDDASRRYYCSTDDGIWARVAATNPEAVRQWLGFCCTPREDQHPDGTSVGFRLSDGTSDYFWDGNDWVEAEDDEDDWSPESDVAEHISTFPATSKRLGVVINLKTTDRFTTPTVSAVSVLMSCRVRYVESLVADSLLASLAEQPFEMDYSLRAAGGAAISVKELDDKYAVSDVTGVYNLTTDSDRATNLRSSFDATNRRVLLSSSVNAGTPVWLELSALIQSYLNFASEDYVEVQKTPAVILDSFTMSAVEIAAQAWVHSVATHQAVVRRFPILAQLEFAVTLLTDSSATLLAMQERILQFVADNPLLRWRALDEEIALSMPDGGHFEPRPNFSRKHSGTCTMLLRNIHLWLASAQTLPTVQRFHATLVTSTGDVATWVTETGQVVIDGGTPDSAYGPIYDGG